MQYVLLIHQGTTPLPGTPEWEALPADVQSQVYADYQALHDLPGVSSGLPLGLAVDAKTVQVHDGKAKVSDGTWQGADKCVGGWMIVDADTPDAAVEIARRIPAARLGGAIEVRPVQTYW